MENSIFYYVGYYGSLGLFCLLCSMFYFIFIYLVFYILSSKKDEFLAQYLLKNTALFLAFKNFTQKVKCADILCIHCHGTGLNEETNKREIQKHIDRYKNFKKKTYWLQTCLLLICFVFLSITIITLYEIIK